MVLSNEDLDKIKTIIHSTFNEKFLNKIANKVAEMVESKFEAKISGQTAAIDKVKTQVAVLESKNLELQTRNVELMKKIDDQEQSSRSLNVRLFGIPYDNKGEENLRADVIRIFIDKFKVNVKDADIQKCYRVRAKNPSDKPPAVIIRFANDTVRSAVLNNRKNLKGSGVNIKEDLTKIRLFLLESAVKKFTYRNAWCLNGNIFVRSNNIVHRISDSNDINSIASV